MQKTTTIYDKNGNPMDINPAVKSAYVGKGWFEKDPTKEKDKKTEKKES